MAKAKAKPVRSKARKVRGIVPNYDGKIPALYANFASISSTGREVFIDLCVVAPPYELDENENIQAPVVVRIITNREFTQSLHEALTTRLNVMKSQGPEAAQVKAK